MFSSAQLRHRFVSFVCVTLLLLLCLIWPGSAYTQVQVLTEHNDVRRSGANTSETVLTPANVNTTTFGKLFTQSVDGFIVGQPLYLSAVSFPDGTIHNVVIVVTQHDSVYAFDADSAQTPLWTGSFIQPDAGITPVPIGDHGCPGTGFLEIGIVSTPVIDATTGTIFVLAKTSENGIDVFRLHALSVTTGADVMTPAVISASVPTNAGTLQFSPAFQMQRPALLLENGTVYIGFGSNGCDTYAYHGWLLAYDATTLQQVGAFATTPNGTRGAIWQGGGGPAADSDGTIFLATANGTFTANTGGSDYGDSLLHLSPAASGLAVLDYFTPFNQQSLANNDTDLGSGGVILLPDQDAPHTHEVLGGGKEGTLYLVDRDSMGGFNAADDSEIVQSVPTASSGELIGVPAYWNGRVYISGEDDFIKAFTLSDELSTQPVSQTAAAGPSPSSISISANGSNAGILWSVPLNSVAVLYAYDASNLGTVLYSSAQAPNSRDTIGSIPKFVAPTIANGKVYLGGTNALTVFGLLPTISPATGNNQFAFVGTTLPVALQLQVVDAYQGQPIGNASITCKDGGVGGAFGAAMPMVTDSQGQVSTTYTLPKKAQTVTINCTNVGFVTATFTETGIAGPVSGAIIVSGNNQTGTASTQLPAPLVMQVIDPFSFGVPGVAVTFSDGGAGGTFSPVSTTTDNLGQASTSYTTPSNAGTVTVSASTAGLSPLKFTATVTNPVPNFALSATPGTISVAQGGSAPTTVSVTPSGGFAGSVQLSTSGLPNGVTASFNPASTTASSTLTLSASNSASTGTGTFTVTGASGSLSSTTTVSLTVTGAAAYSLSGGMPNPPSVHAGGISTVPLTITPNNGYTGSVKLSCAIAPVVTPAPSCAISGTNPLTVGSTGASAALVFSTVGASAANLSLTHRVLYAVWLPLPVLALAGFGLNPRRRKIWSRYGLLMLLAGLIALPACGGGNSTPHGSGGTPAGTYSITITGTDGNNVPQSNPPLVVSITVN